MEIESIILRTDDVDRSTAFWSEVVGLGVIDSMPGFSFLEGGAVMLIISRIERRIADNSLTEIALGSDEVRKEYRQMADRGVPFEGELGPPIISRDGKDLVAAFFRDPDGHYGRLSGWVESE